MLSGWILSNTNAYRLRHNNQRKRILPNIKLFRFLYSFLGSFNSLIIHPKIRTKTPLYSFGKKIDVRKKRHIVHDQSSKNQHDFFHQKTHHEVSGVYRSHLYRLTCLQPQLFHNVFFCSANLLLCCPIGNRANFYSKSA